MAKIIINNVEIKVKMNKNGHFRGLHTVILDPKTGKIEISQVFDTYEKTGSKHFDNFIQNFNKISKNGGKIVIIACKDECTKNLSKTSI